jgi:diaminopimelate decarboxylase
MKNLFQNIATPFYYYDMDLMQRTFYNAISEAEKYNYQIHYALKANTNERVLQTALEYGFGADCVSGNEVIKAVESGFNPKKIVFAGVGKTDEEIEYALQKNIFSFNVESLEELEVIGEIAKKNQIIANIALRINPGVDAHTHKYLTTGIVENKFGIDRSDILKSIKIIFNNKFLNFNGLHFHIGSQITSLEPFIELCKSVNEIQDELNLKNIFPENINLGGGFGINYENPDKELIPDFKTFFSTINKFLKIRNNQKIHFELGRSLVAQSGTLVSKVLYVKKGQQKDFVILDAGMTDLIRPSLYGSVHKIENFSSQSRNTFALAKYDVVGPVCESSDRFAEQLRLPETHRGDLIFIRSTGAYGQIMSSNYNLRKNAPAVYSDELIQKSRLAV